MSGVKSEEIRLHHETPNSWPKLRPENPPPPHTHTQKIGEDTHKLSSVGQYVTMMLLLYIPGSADRNVFSWQLISAKWGNLKVHAMFI
jgi:hypothetical protein